MSVESDFDFRRVLSPIAVEEFFEGYYEQRPFYVPRNDPHYYDPILTYREFDGFFQNMGIPAQAIRLNRRGDEIHSSVWANGLEPCSVANNDKMFEHFGQGTTLVINGANRFFGHLNDFCLCLEREVRIRIQPNIYITPAFEQGFRTHYDDHDVMIFQIHGSKIWSVFHSPLELPGKKQPYRGESYELGTPIIETEVHAGDLVYVPRGFLHHAITGHQPSIHITIGLHPWYWFDAVREIARLAEDRPEFRRAVPLRYQSPQRVEAAKEAFKGSVARFVDSLDVDLLLSNLMDLFESYHHSDVRGRFDDLMRVHNLGLDTVLVRRKDAILRAERNGRDLHIKTRNKSLTFPWFLKPSLSVILERERFAIRDLGGMLNDEGRIDLARQFIAEGVLSVESSDG